jgi:hypothetical protein
MVPCLLGGSGWRQRAVAIRPARFDDQDCLHEFDERVLRGTASWSDGEPNDGWCRRNAGAILDGRTEGTAR